MLGLGALRETFFISTAGNNVLLGKVQYFEAEILQMKALRRCQENEVNSNTKNFTFSIHRPTPTPYFLTANSTSQSADMLKVSFFQNEIRS